MIICSSTCVNQLGQIPHCVVLMFRLFQAAQRLTIEEQSRILGEQLDQLRRQSQNMADTQKKVEDAIKRRRKK